MKFLVVAILLLPTLIFAQDYKPLVGIPGVNPNSDFDTYINTLYALSISIAALLAVIKIIIAGVKWMLTDVVTSKENAKRDIKGALLGLLVVLGAVLILTVINPDILKVNFSLDTVSTTTTSDSTTLLTATCSNTTYDADTQTLVPCNSGVTYDCTAAAAMCTITLNGTISTIDTNGCLICYTPAPPPQPTCVNTTYDTTTNTPLACIYDTTTNKFNCVLASNTCTFTLGGTVSFTNATDGCVICETPPTTTQITLTCTPVTDPIYPYDCAAVVNACLTGYSGTVVLTDPITGVVICETSVVP